MTVDQATAKGESMALSRLAQEFADEIAGHDWLDAPYRWDQAGHRREHDRKAAGTQTLTPEETLNLLRNVVAVTTQVLRHRDPNLDVYEFAEACGLDTRTHSGRSRDGGYVAAIRWESDGVACAPGRRRGQ
ncbi:hypothetical protein [Nocardia bhagyanarayanae]|nr:hypothetical protein [Nocardia bhagyanarayanae]